MSNLKERKKGWGRKAPLSAAQLDLNGLLGLAMVVGRLQHLCITKHLRWAAFYTEKRRLEQETAEFTRKYLNRGSKR